MRSAAALGEVSNHVWDAGRLADAAPRFTGFDDACRRLACLTGQFAFEQPLPEGGHLLARDPLGVNKLFWTITRSGELVRANYIADLVETGVPLHRIWSVPSGHAAWVEPRQRRYELRPYAAITFNTSAESQVPGAVVDAIRHRLEYVFSLLRQLAAGRHVYVCLSGGMDSTGIAVMARETFGAFTGVTFALQRDAGRRLDAQQNDDLETAERLAGDLGAGFLPVFAAAEDVVKGLDDVLRYGQDWRDFNVHCGLVNHTLGAAIAAHHRRTGRPGRPLVLTGDTMNELMADYTPVHYKGREYYTLPRLPQARLRSFLVGGLDSGDREVGIFAHHGVDAIQPYALCAAAYAAVPAGAITNPSAKQALAREIFGGRIPEYVYRRPKVRAQAAGDDVAGTLALLADRGIGQDVLAQRFARLFDAQTGDLKNFIRAGFYRFPAQFPNMERES